MTRILAIADQEDEGLYGQKLLDLKPDLVLSCGDLDFDYLENLVSRTDVPLLYVPGNHDPDLRLRDSTWDPLAFEADPPGPRGCLNVDGRILEVAGLRVAGLGGSLRYREGPNQYTEGQMRRRALGLRLRARLSRTPVDLVLSHAPPAGDDPPGDPVHKGFEAFERLDLALKPRFHLHGHVLPNPGRPAERRLGETTVVNAIPYKLLDI